MTVSFRRAPPTVMSRVDAGLHCAAQQLSQARLLSQDSSNMLIGGCAGIVDVCLIPEVPFRLDGDTGLLAYVDKVLSERGHCVLCVAEGAGQVRKISLGPLNPLL